MREQNRRRSPREKRLPSKPVGGGGTGGGVGQPRRVMPRQASIPASERYGSKSGRKRSERSKNRESRRRERAARCIAGRPAPRTTCLVVPSRPRIPEQIPAFIHSRLLAAQVRLKAALTLSVFLVETSGCQRRRRRIVEFGGERREVVCVVGTGLAGLALRDDPGQSRRVSMTYRDRSPSSAPPLLHRCLPRPSPSSYQPRSPYAPSSPRHPHRLHSQPLRKSTHPARWHFWR